MINTVKKRDGSEEPFDADKLNKWLTWASEECDVHWSDVVFKAIRKVHEGVHTDQIQQALIDSCLEYRTDGHTKMAARLLVGVIYKEAYGDFSIPSLPSLYEELVDGGYWADMGYSFEELQELDQVIDHTKDFTYAYATLKQYYDKYAMRAYGRVWESPQVTLMGIAMSNMSGERNRLESVKSAYKDLSNLNINLPTPTLNLERTPHLPAPSCTVISGNDTVESIGAASHIAYEMTAKSAGIGVELRTRAPKDPVKGGKIEHGGKHGYYSYLARAVSANSQMTRGGSATVTFHCLDPEVEKLLTLKLQRTDPTYRIDTLDYSFAVNNLFLRKVAKGEDWMLTSCYSAPDLWDASYAGDEALFERLYESYLDSNVKKRIVKARDVFGAWVRARGDTGRVYMTFLDNINSHTPFKDPVRLSNLCVAPETQILTDQGYTPIAELEGESVNVWNGREWSETKVYKTGQGQKLLKVITDSGYELECTPYHKFYLAVGYRGEVKEVRASDLKSGDKLIKFDLPIVEGHEVLDKAYENGFYTGDGTCVGNRQRIYLYNDKKDLKHHFSDGHSGWRYSTSSDRFEAEYADLKDKFFVPSDKYTIKSRLEWLAGYVDADGCIYRNGANNQLVCTSVEYSLLKQVQLMLQTLGVSAKITGASQEGYKTLPMNNGTGESGEFWCREAWRLIITSCDLYKLLKLGLSFKRLEANTRLPQRDAKRFVKVVEVVDEGRIDDTFCFTEPKRGMGMFNGILTGQCQEVLLPTQGFENVGGLYNKGAEGETALCNLASICINNVSDDDYEQVAYNTLKIVDNTIERGVYPFPHIEHTAKARRSAGVGITGLASYLASRGLVYDSEEGRNEIHRVAERHSYWLHKASARLAKEKGSCDWMHKTKYIEGWLPVDTYKRAVDEHHSETLRFDWEALREEVLEHGVRFSVLESCMPTESSSLFTNSTNGLYPIRDVEIFKNSRKGMVYFRAPDFENKFYQNAYDIDHLDMVKVYSIFQKFMGQGISADFWTTLDGEDTKLSMKDMLQRVLMSAKLGMKTYYYENFRTNAKKEIEIEEDDCESCKL